MAAANSHFGRPAAAAAASRALGDRGPPVCVVVDDDDDELFSDATAAITAAVVEGLENCSRCGGGTRSWGRHGSAAAADAVSDRGDNRLLVSGSGLSALRLQPLRLPVSDNGSCKHAKVHLRLNNYTIK